MLRPALLALSFAPTLAAQFLTSPAGLLNREGDTDFPVFGAAARFLQVDNTHRGQSFTVRSLAWRREGGVAQSAHGPRTMQMTIALGRGNFGLVSEIYDDNFVAGTRSTVFQGNVSFPDWRNAVPGPAPFDLAVSLTRPFVYNGASALVVDVEYTAPTFDRPWVDMEGPSSSGAGTASTAGAGCYPSGTTRVFTLGVVARNYGSAAGHQFPLRLEYRAYDGPRAATSFLALLDHTERNVPGLCAPLRALPTISFALPASLGGLRWNVGFPYSGAVIGMNLVTQLVAPDPGQPSIPVALSIPYRFTWSSYQNAALPDCATVTNSAQSDVGTLVIGRGLITRLGI